MKLTIPKGNYSITNLYDTVATEMGYTNTTELEYDCTEINIAENIQDGIYQYYSDYAKEVGSTSSETDIRTATTMILAISGPKVDKELRENEVEVFEGFICNRKEN